MSCFCDMYIVAPAAQTRSELVPKRHAIDSKMHPFVPSQCGLVVMGAACLPARANVWPWVVERRHWQAAWPHRSLGLDNCCQLCVYMQR